MMTHERLCGLTGVRFDDFKYISLSSENEAGLVRAGITVTQGTGFDPCWFGPSPWLWERNHRRLCAADRALYPRPDSSLLSRSSFMLQPHSICGCGLHTAAFRREQTAQETPRKSYTFHRSNAKSGCNGQTLTSTCLKCQCWTCV